MLSIITTITVLIALVSLLPLSQYPHWIIRGMDFPRLQIAILAVVLLIADFTLLDFDLVFSWVLVSVTTVCLVWQLWWILPYTFIWPLEAKGAVEEDPDRRVTILTSNVLTPNRNSDALIKLVRSYTPDVLVTLETDQWWEDKLNVLESDMPYSVKCPLDNLYGMHVFSRLPLDEKEISYLVEKDVPSIHVLVTLRSGDKVRMHFLHPAPPSPSENPESTERDAELVIVGRSVAECEQPVIVTGDLNDVAWSATTRLFRKLSGLLDPRVGRGMFNTFHAKYPLLRWPLDHLFHSRHFTVKSIKRLPSIGSDHFPLLTTLVHEPTQTPEQDGLNPDSDDYERSEEIAKKEQVSKVDVPGQ